MSFCRLATGQMMIILRVLIVDISEESEDVHCVGRPFGRVDTWGSPWVFPWMAKDSVGCDDGGVDHVYEVLVDVGIAAGHRQRRMGAVVRRHGRGGVGCRD